MPETPVSFDQPTTELRSGGRVVGITDRVYPTEGESVTFADVLVRGDLSGDLEYNGAVLRVVQVEEIIGLEVGPSGPRGPVWRGVKCQILR